MKKLFILLGLLFAFQTLSWAEKLNNTILSAPPMKNPPVIDGTLGGNEWAEAVKLSGCGWLEVQDPRQFELWMGYDDNNLYFAGRSELPPGGKLLTKACLGQDVANDDSVELIIVPPTERPQGPLQFGFFQLRRCW
ncbi:MAG: hypothetical protein WCS52_13785 [bacterium]